LLVAVGLDVLRHAHGPAGHYAWEWYCHHLHYSGGQVEDLLLDFSWLSGKLGRTDVASLLADFEFAESLTSTKVEASIRQSADVLTRDASQLGPQLLARLSAEVDDDRIARLLEEASSAPGARLEPRWPCMTLGAETAEAVLRGHTNKVWSAAQLPDGRVATGSEDETIRLVDVSRPSDQVAEDHHGGVWALTVLEDGRLASGGKDGVVRIWRAVSNGLSLEREFVGHESDVECVLELDKETIVSGGHDGTVRVWNIAHPRQQPVVLRHDGIVWGLACLPDGRIISASADRTARVWNRSSEQELTRFIGHTNEVNAVAVLPTGDVATCSDDATCRIWNPDTGAQKHVLLGHTGGVCTILADGATTLYSGGVDRVLRKWNWQTEELDNIFQGHSADINAIVRLKSGRILTASDDQTCRVWDCSADKDATTHLRHSGAVLALAADSELGLVSGGTDGRIRRWDHQGALLAEAASQGLVESIDVTASGLVVFGGSEDSVGVWSGRTGDRPTIRVAEQAGISAVTALSGGLIATAGIDGTVAIRGDDLKCVRKWPAHDGPVHAIVDLGQGLVATCGDDRIRVFNADSGDQVALVSKFEGDRCSLVRASEGDLLIGSPNGLIRRWSPIHQRDAIVSEAAHGVERGLRVVSPSYLVAFTGLNSVGVVDAACGQVAAEFTGDAEVLSLVSGGGFIAVGASSGAIYVLDLVNLPVGGLNASGPRDLV
jgi:WD40 repeat protein